MKNDECLTDFLSWLSLAHSKATVSSYHWALKVFVDYLEGQGIDLVELSQNNILKYEMYLKEDRVIKNSTIAIYLTSLKKFIKWSRKNGLVSVDESLIEIPKDLDKVSYPFILPQEYNKMFDVLNDCFPEQLRVKIMISVLHDTGVRLSELLAIDLSQVDTTTMKATVKNFKAHNKTREIYWGNRTNELLKKWIGVRNSFATEAAGPSNALFVNLRKTQFHRMKTCQFQRDLRHLRKRVGIDRCITAHSFRHGFGYTAVQNNVHPRHLQIMLGHSKLNTTMLYMGVGDKDVEDVYRQKMAFA